MTITQVKNSLSAAGIPTWAQAEITGPDGAKEIAVAYEDLEAFGNVERIKAMASIPTDKGLVFTTA